jgi:hypothetical protein
VSSLRYDVLGGDKVRVRAGFDADAEMVSGFEDAGHLHLWLLDKATKKAVGYAAFDLGQAGAALAEARRCRAG